VFLAIDLGSSAFKAAVFDAGLRRLALGRAALAYLRGPGGRVELEVEEAERALGRAIRAALAGSGRAARQLKAVAVTSQAQTFCILDRRGTPRTRFISWLDLRAARSCRKLKRLPALADFAGHSSFGELLPALQICQLRRIRDEQPRLIRPGDAVADLPVCLLGRMTGAFRIDENLAAMSGLYSLKRRGWWPAALAACGLDARQLPAILPIGAADGRTAAGAGRFGLPAGIPVILAGNDQTAGAYGARVQEGNRVLLTLGTAHVAYACRRRMPPSRSGLIRGPYPGGRWYAMRVASPGGDVVDWARERLGCGKAEDRLFKLAAAAVPGCGGVTFHPGLPVGKSRWTGPARRRTPANLARAVLESLAGRLADAAKALLPSRARSEVLAAGGGSRQPLWVGMIAEKLGAPVRTADADPLLGAAMMAREHLAGGS
jgi:xylulokinase